MYTLCTYIAYVRDVFEKLAFQVLLIRNNLARQLKFSASFLVTAFHDI